MGDQLFRPAMTARVVELRGAGVALFRDLTTAEEEMKPVGDHQQAVGTREQIGVLGLVGIAQYGTA